MASLVHQIKVRQRDKRIYNFILKQRRRRIEAALRVAREEFFHHSLPGGCYFIPEYQDFISVPSSGIALRRGFSPIFYEKKSSIFTLFKTLPAEIQLMIWEFASNKPTYMEHRHRTHQKELVHLSRNQEAQGRIGNLETFIGSGGVNYHNDSLGLLRSILTSQLMFYFSLALGHDSIPWLLNFDFDAPFWFAKRGAGGQVFGRYKIREIVD
ncbi:hypothetical protein BCON_0355g00030 [Botryotinia convoluta]|uniref:2EXR domain-containing protein n=1 Tax=Botryotinia convoluta TaxID=54673 RepID=A0A4Z1H9W7_9HELO|nr:hypothetical protein BCON_0355g00030 [Botryotinia convoluta]